MFFVYSPDSGFETVGTAKEARSLAEKSIELYREEAEDGWDEEVGNVCWGAVTQMSNRGEAKNACDFHCCEDGCDGHHSLDIYCDYSLKDVSDA